MSMPPIGDMLLFVDVVNQKSFTKAAKIHRLTSAAVSKRMMSLERLLGLKLLNRSTRKLILTEAGEVLYKSSQGIYDDVLNAYNLVLDSHKNPKGNIVISSPTNFSNLVLCPILGEFLTKNPGIHIKVILDDSRGLPERGEYDLAIRAGFLENNSVIVRPFSSIRFVTCAAPAYFEKYGIPHEPGDLKQHNCIDYSYRHGGPVWHYTKNEKLISTPANGNLVANNAHFVKMVALAGAGIVHLPQFMVHEEIKKKQLLTCLDEYTSQTIPISIIYPFSSKLLPKKITLLIDYLMSKLKSVENSFV